MTGNTALQVYFNPDDLNLYIGEEKGKENIWGLVISRGPRLEQHPFMVLLSSNENSNFTKEKALEIMETTLRAAKKFGDDIFTNTEHELLKILSCGGEFKSKQEYVDDRGPVLEDSDIERIMAELKNDQKGNNSETFQWENWKERYPREEAA